MRPWWIRSIILAENRQVVPAHIGFNRAVTSAIVVYISLRAHMVHAVCIIAMTLAVVLVVPRIFWVRIRIVTHWQILVLGRAYRICRNPPWVGLYELWVFAIWRHGPLSAWTAIVRPIWTWGTAIAVLTMPAKAVQVLRTKDRVNTSTTVLDQAPDTD